MEHRERVLVIGNGMASHRLCAVAAERGLPERFAIRVVGEEPYPAYDRVNLHHVLDGRPLAGLSLADEHWYRRAGIDLHLGYRVTAIDRDARTATLFGGKVLPWDRLVFATGARARRPEVPGIDLPGVFAYRTYDDVHRLRFAARAAKRVVLVGGGVLALELAEVIARRRGGSCRLEMLERADWPCAAQLDARGGRFLAQRLVSMGVATRFRVGVTAIEAAATGLSVVLEGGGRVAADLVVVVAGIVPEDGLARDSGLATLAGGGIVVDETLSTGDPRVHAIGDCAAFRGRVSGLVAPAWEMADCLARRIDGEAALFEPRPAPFISKTDALELGVIALGDSRGETPGIRFLRYRRAASFRYLVLDGKRVVGAASIGDWPELDRVQQLVETGAPLSAWRRLRFRLGGRIASGGSRHVSFLPDTAIVCHCMGVSRGTLESAWQSGHDRLELLVGATGAGTVCGACRHSLTRFCGERRVLYLDVTTLKLFWSSVLALLLVVLFVRAGPWPRSGVFSGAADASPLLDAGLRTTTGYTAAGLLAVSMLVSVRKRLGFAAAWGSTALWRTGHACVSMAALLVLVFHTALRWGAGLSFALLCTVLALAVSGGLYGVVARLEVQRVGNVARWRGAQDILFRVHAALFLAFPVLLAAHVFAGLYF